MASAITRDIAVSEGWYLPNTNDGLCHCGCGQSTPLARQSDRSKLWVAGEPLRFVDKHIAKAMTLETRRRMAESHSGEKHHSWKGGHARKGDEHPLYRMWRGMLSRCENTNVSCYPRYGGRGISVCARWHDFRNFLADMGERPEGRSIDRIDNDGNYERGNCRWATDAEQRANRRDSKPKVAA